MRIAGTYPFPTDPDPDAFALRVLSLGAGVQSSRLLLGILEGEFGTPGEDAPSCAVFADTGWEPRPVYAWLAVLRERAEAAGFPVHVVSAGDLRHDALTTRARREAEGKSGRFASMPLHTYNAEGGETLMRRQCTSQYKIRPIRRKVRELAGMAPGRAYPGRHVETWQGISHDELSRIGESRDAWEWRRYPLVERRETRAACLRWLAARGFSAPRSACCGCPFRRSAEWLWLKKHDPEGFASAVAFDEVLRDPAGSPLGWDQPAFLHHDRRPLADVVPDLEARAAAEAAQGDLFADHGLVDECAGHCGV